MRFIYVILIGLIVFNGLLIVFTPLFPGNTYSDSAIDVEDELSGYEDFSGSLLSTLIGNAWAVGIGIFTFTTIIGALTGHLGLFMGVGAFVSVVCGLWYTTMGVIGSITAEYEIVSSIVSIITICIGVIFVFSVVELFTGQKAVN
jgi:hypothetical protein